LVTLCLAWGSASCSAAAGRLSSSPGAALAAPGGRLWASTLPGGGYPVGAVSPDGTTVFVSAAVKRHFETVAYSAATGAQLWAKAHRVASYGAPYAITVSPDGARVYVTGAGGLVTVAYDARTGRQLWASLPKGGAWASGLAVSPDGTSLYVTGSGRGSGPSGQLEFAVIAYAAATGKQRWLRYYNTKAESGGASVAVSPDGKTVYATGAAGSDALTVAYRADGTLRWAARYQSPYAGFAAGSQIVAGPGGGAVYVGGRVPAKAGNVDIATFAYRAGTGQLMWLDRRRGGWPAIAVTPDGRTVVVAGPWQPGGYAMAAYNASTGGTRWARLAPEKYMEPAGLVIDPHGDTVFIGGNRIAAYSAAGGTVLWTAGHGGLAPGPRQPPYSGAIGLSGDGTRLFATWPGSRGSITVAFQT
jgi:DNA-binding beta-propeller fold protein YncE